MQNHLIDTTAKAIYVGYEAYQNQFQAITKLARIRFERRHWHGMRADAAERLDLYKRFVDTTVAEIRELLGRHAQEKELWREMRQTYLTAIETLNDQELAETFFNSITRRIFSTVGVDPNIEFVYTELQLHSPKTDQVTQVYSPTSPSDLAQKLLADYQFDAKYEDSARDVRWIAMELNQFWDQVVQVEMCQAVFFRDKRAYIIGAMNTAGGKIPLVLALTNSAQGIAVDAVLTDENDASILFSFARSYFHVQAYHPDALVSFLHTIMPRKRIAELYISIGYHKQGKTEFYRDFLHHLAHSSDQFEPTPGDRGMVMATFTLPSYDIVFKVFRDRFADPKTVSRQQVIDKYDLVFRHDRAGRLVDAQEFEHLEIERRRFSPALLNELGHLASQTITIEDHHVHIRHAYIERRVTPLNLYLQRKNDDATRAVVIDYGNAIKDLAASNIFPGDILLKNFGVTRHGRVVFYDYDALCLITDCRFSPMPKPRSEAEELAGEEWFYAAENEFFPEEFRTFLGLREDLRNIFVSYHDDLFQADYWRRVQERIHANEVIDILPYNPARQLARRYGKV